MTNQTHDGFIERWGTVVGFEAHNWLMSEHTVRTRIRSSNTTPGATIDETPLEYYYGEAVCLDVSSVRHPEYITVSVLESALASSGQEMRRGDIVLLFTGHGDRTYPSKEFADRYSGLDRAAATWLAEKGVVNIGVDALSIDHTDDEEFSGHMVCAEYQIVNTENLTNLDRLVNRRFLFFGLPLNFRAGTGSPVRAIVLARGITCARTSAAC